MKRLAYDAASVWLGLAAFLSFTGNWNLAAGFACMAAAVCVFAHGSDA